MSDLIPAPVTVTASTEPCNCWGGPEHRRLLATTEHGPIVSCCEWAMKLMAELANGLPSPGWVATFGDVGTLAWFKREHGIEATEPDAGWLKRLAEARD